MRFNRQFFSDFWRLLKPYWVSNEKWLAWSFLGLAVLLSVIEVRASVALNSYNKDFFDAIQAFNKAGLITALWHCGIVIIIQILAFGYGAYFNSLLSFRWRKWLTTHYLKQWLNNHVHYRMQVLHKNVDNPDQRISEDLAEFPAITLSLTLTLFQASLTLFSFGYVLWSLSGHLSIPIGHFNLVIPGYLCWVALLYALVGTWIIRWIGKTMATLNYEQQQYNADFRFSLVRFREASEQVALYGGESHEHNKFQYLFSRIFSNFISIVTVQKHLNFFVMGYNTTAGIFGLVISMPLYLAKKILLGTVVQIAGAFSAVIGSLSIFINSFNTFADWRAVISRLTEFSQLMNGLNLDSKITIKKHEQKDIIIDNLALNTPDGKSLLEKINLVFQSGKATLLSGPSGLGKSIFLRAIAGLWPHGQGCIHLPKAAHTLFLPQKPYFPLGTLKEALLYPSHHTVDDQTLQAALSLCHLDKFKHRLNDIKNWSHELSLGEQQLIAFARIFLTKPDVVFLDEATSALDEETEYQIYENLRKLLPEATIISIGHRSSIHKHHDRLIDFSTLLYSS